MQVTETVSEGLKRELKVVVGAQELDARLTSKLADLKDRVRLKGFRPGKVPLDHLRKFYGRSVMAEVVQEAVLETTREALKDRDERPAFQPAISLPEDKGLVEKVIGGEADLEYTMSFEILPTIELADLKQIAIEKEVAEVAEEDVDKGINQLRQANLSYQTKDGAAEEGDRLTIDFVGKIDGEAFDGGTAEDAFVILGRGGFIPGFEEGLAGARGGEARTITAAFPEGYPAEALAGRDATFEVTVKEVAAPAEPEITDDFANQLGVDSVEKLRQAVRDKLAEEFTAASRDKAKRALLDALDAAHDFELPPSLVENEFRDIWADVTGHLQRANRTFEDEGTSEEEAQQRYRRLSERRVRLGLVLSEIGTRNEIAVNDEEVRRAVIERARQYPGQEGQVLQFYKKNPGAMAELRAPIFEDKVVDFILELAKVTEKKVSPDILFQQDDDEHDHHHHEHGPDCDHDHDHGRPGGG